MDSAAKTTICYCFEGSKVVTLMYSVNETNNTIRYAACLYKPDPALDENGQKRPFTMDEIMALKAQHKILFKRGSARRKSHLRTVQHRYNFFPVYVSFPSHLRQELQQLREIKVPAEYGKMHRHYDKQMKKYLRLCMGDPKLGVCIVTKERRQQLNMKMRESKSAQKDAENNFQKMPATGKKTIKGLIIDTPLTVENVSVSVA